MRLRLRIPATIANLGPGFDILALAIQLQNDVEAEMLHGAEVEIDPGPGAPEELRDPSKNLIVHAYHAACERLGVPREQRGLRIRVASAIPMGRGMGSSAAATLAGVLCANVLRGEGAWDEHAVLDVATEIEGHPDNCAAALLGGLVICAPGHPVRQIEIPDALRCVIFVPHAESSTTEARKVVPREYSREDAVFNAARCALLVRAMLLGELDELGFAMEDRWHQPARSRLFPAMEPVIAAAREAGAHGAALAGAGPSVVALVTSDAEPIGAAMEAAAREAGVPGSVIVHGVRNWGTRIELLL